MSSAPVGDRASSPGDSMTALSSICPPVAAGADGISVGVASGASSPHATNRSDEIVSSEISSSSRFILSVLHEVDWCKC